VSELPTAARGRALDYARLGWRVFPVVSGGKRPLYRGWQRDATTDPGQIARYWRADPAPNIGVVCGAAFDALDIEADYLDRLRSWMAEPGHVLPRTPIARTGRGGIHILVQPLGIGGGRDLFLAGEHVGELKSIGGFIVVSPSVTVGPYTWLREPLDTPAAAPAWLLALLERPRRPRPATPSRARQRGGGGQLRALSAAVGRAAIGSRNKILYWAMRRALEEGAPPRDAGLTLARAALSAGLGRHEVEATIRSAYEASLR
jgi:hypothetical protein